MTSRELNQDLGRAKRAAEDGPVIITDRGRPAHVLMSIAEYTRLTGGARSLGAALAMPGLSEIALEPPKSALTSRPADLG
nr:type II toxin-antitoxin system prevent-host-death family antitoxin [Mangrovicoccus algicola]